MIDQSIDGLAETYSVRGELWWVVVDVGDPDDGGGSVGQAVGGVALHVGGLDDQRVLRDFLQRQEQEEEESKSEALPRTR